MNKINLNIIYQLFPKEVYMYIFSFINLKINKHLLMTPSSLAMKKYIFKYKFKEVLLIINNLYIEYIYYKYKYAKNSNIIINYYIKKDNYNIIKKHLILCNSCKELNTYCFEVDDDEEFIYCHNCY
jgi:hypothetical protein